MSEVSAATIRRAHAVHPLAAVQTEYSLWTRNAEVAVLDTCRELGITFVAFSPLARGFLTGELRDVSALPPKDIRLNMPRFQAGHWEKNLAAARTLRRGRTRAGVHDGPAGAGVAAGAGAARRPDSRARRASTTCARTWARSTSGCRRHTVERLDGLINTQTVSGPRYNAATLPEIDTEDV